MLDVAKNLRFDFKGAFALISPFEDVSLPEEIAQLSLLCEATREILPAVFLVHPGLEVTYYYQYPLEKGKVNAEMLLLWARHSSIQMEKPGLLREIEKMREDPDFDPEELAYWERIFEGGEEDLKYLNDRFFEILDELSGKQDRKAQLIDEIMHQEEL